MSTFFISDLHFDHRNICVFTRRKDGVDQAEPLRPWNDVEEHNEAIVKNWNEKVGSGAKVYILGDTVIPKKGLRHLNRLNGYKVLVPGNHDQFSARRLLEHVQDIRGVVTFEKNGWILSHVPIHESQLDTRWKLNIHGHLHDNVIDNPNYLNVGCEQVGYTPLHYDEIWIRWKSNKETFANTGKVINFSDQYVNAN